MRKIALTTLLALIMIVSVSATTISDEKVTVDLQDSTVNAEIDVTDLTTETFNYQTSHPVEQLSVIINEQKANCNVEQLTVGSTINCETNLRENFTVKISYKTTGLVDSQENIDVFRYSQSIYRPVQDYTFRVILPEGTGVVDQEDATTNVINPNNGEVGNMGGRRFDVEWNTNPQLGQPQSFRVLFEPFESSPSNKLFIPGSVLAFLAVIGITYFVYKRKNKVTASNIIEALGDDEKMIVKMLKNSEGEMLQKDIVEKSEYSKAKISGVVSSLVEEDIVTKEKEGRSNKVSLKEHYHS